MSDGKKATQVCPCGYLGHPNGRCRCTGEQVTRYRARISGPLLDRIDMHVEVPPLPQAELLGSSARDGESSAVVRERVLAARARMLARSGRPNARLSAADVEAHCGLSRGDSLLLARAIDQLGLSARAAHRILRLARTVADLGGREAIATPDLAEAIGYRRPDRR